MANPNSLQGYRFSVCGVLPRYSRMCWGPGTGFWVEGSHSRGCSVHRSHKQPEGWMRSAAVGYHPVWEWGKQTENLVETKE